MILSRSVLFKRERVQVKFVENVRTRILGSNFFFENHVVYEIMGKNTVEPDMPQMVTIWCMRMLMHHIATICGMSGATVFFPIIS